MDYLVVFLYNAGCNIMTYEDKIFSFPKGTKMNREFIKEIMKENQGKVILNIIKMED